jgi:hypothetical protein
VLLYPTVVIMQEWLHTLHEVRMGDSTWLAKSLFLQPRQINETSCLATGYSQLDIMRIIECYSCLQVI